jgi:hypothetical protein
LGEVAPAGARAAALERGHELLRDDHRLRICQHVEALVPEQDRDGSSDGCGDHGVADVDVDAELDSRSREARLEHGAYARVHVIVADGLRGDRVEQEHHAVLDVHRRDLDDQVLDCRGFVIGPQGQQVHVAGGPAQIEGREQQPALQHEPLVVSRADEAAEEALEDVELEQLGGGPLLRPGEALEREVAGTGEVGVGGFRRHERIRRA